MRKYIKNKILSVMELMEECEKEINQLLATDGVESVKQLLTELQQTAIDIGTQIELAEGEGTGVVYLLEEYCEFLWRCSQGNNAKEALQYCTKIEKVRKKAEQALKQEVSEEYEVVFFPYKASMWDSMESVWLSAQKNPKCEAYVVPIPYYEKNSNGDFEKECYEGNSFPDYVPIVAWENYNVEARRPDVIYIHNPYDNGNNITSVHPAYYAKRLREYTNMLVYIPYFVLGEDFYESFCVCAGTLYANKVIVQSERVRRECIRCFKEFVHDNHFEMLFSDKVIEEKFLALGSPKIDKAVNERKEDYVLPEAWAELIKGKKAILYNTGVSGILNGNEQELEKISDTIEFFRKRNDVVLWWRPHPLSERTCVAMRPLLFERYQELVKEYKKEGFGIYDDTADLHRAIIYTDMYYGDDSSLVYLYGIQGKPIMIQNPYLLLNSEENVQDRSICFDDCAYEDGKIWFTPRSYNGLLEMDLESGTIQCLGRIPDEETAVDNLYGRIFKDKDDLWLIPHRAKELVRYSLRDKEFKKYSILGERQGKVQKLQYALLESNKIYMVSGDYGKIITFHLDDYFMEIDDKLIAFVRSLDCYKPCRISVFPNICKVNEKLYFAINETNIVVEYDLMTKSVEKFSVGLQSNKYLNIVYDGKCFWLIPHLAGNIVKWDKENNKVWELQEYPSDFNHLSWFKSACYQNGFIWLFPARGNMILKISVDTMEITKVNQKDKNYDVTFVKKIGDNRLLSAYRYSFKEQTVFVLDDDGRNILEQELKIAEDYKKGSMQLFPRLERENYETQKEYILYENKEINIGLAASQLVQLKNSLESEKKCFSKLYSDFRGTAGEKIMQNILQLM